MVNQCDCGSLNELIGRLTNQIVGFENISKLNLGLWSKLAKKEFKVDLL